ncbi:trypsin-like peptidase domain-containing protein [Rhizobiales bacterium]|uniref:S1C family serine protease n=1 Tax=Hongsoonwoonella zoysiae TaxID=2821844 RepID=UPI0015616128|nr:trypsin-like peptidase domain-containing protein [Hongsoonwoonella zoysiae]NRG18363.1 trypsin-like peptidase domain-containing protein [Hongsoonwoonella zoysiae]
MQLTAYRTVFAGIAVSTLLCAAGAQAQESAVAKAREAVVALLPAWPKGQANLEEPEGSAVAVGDGTWLVTADHVLGPAAAAMIRRADGSVHPVEIVSRDRQTDLAILKTGAALPALEFAAEDPDVAERVCAIGNAFGLGISVSCGVVSAVGRGGVGFNPVEDFIQTDASVNPGASGGALVDERGRLVGVLSAIFTKSSDGDLGVNFAASAPLVEAVLNSVATSGRMEHVTLGVALELTKLGPEPAGLLVRRLEEQGPAARAGLLEGDVILGVDDFPVSSVAGLRGRLARAGPQPEISVRRNGKTEVLTIKTK